MGKVKHGGGKTYPAAGSLLLILIAPAARLGSLAEHASWWCGVLCFERLEARVGIEPTRKGFADLSLTTWVPRLIVSTVSCFARKIQRFADKTCLECTILTLSGARSTKRLSRDCEAA